MHDFIIVGRGLAAMVLMHTFEENGISFFTLGKNELSGCSRVAAGIWNPVVFKRMNRSWKAAILLKAMHEFYSSCENKMNSKFLFTKPIIRGFTEEHEKNLWLRKSKNELDEFLSAKIFSDRQEEFTHLNLSSEYGMVSQSGHLDVKLFLDKTSEFFSEKISDEVFDYGELKIEADKIFYKNHEAKNIIFCEGHLAKKNPYFNWIPLEPAKGELFTIKAADLKLKNFVYNRNGFLLPLRNDLYKVGSTFEWDDLSQTPTEKGKKELHEKAKQLLNCPYEVISHECGIRPSTFDRRPLIGRHPQFERVFVFNGLGTRGVMLAPYCAGNIARAYLQKEELDTEINLARAYRLFFKE